MDIELLRQYCLSKNASSESFPFDEVTLVFKVLDKIFAIIPLDEEYPSVNLKCDPTRSIELRETYGAIKPGFHMNKRHWNTVDLHSELADDFIFQLVDHSYEMVVKNMTISKRSLLQN